MDFENMKKDKDFQKWCFDTELVGNKNWFNLENGSGDEVYIAYEAWVASQQRKQAEIDALKEKIDSALELMRQPMRGTTSDLLADIEDILQ